MRARAVALVAVCGLLTVVAPVPAQQLPGTELSLRPGDILQIAVWPDATLGGQFTVESTGLVYLPFLGETRVTGMSLSQLREELTRGYSVAMQNPIITITPLFRVGVQGAVNRPGMYFVPPTDQLFDVIGTAGGFSADAKPSSVKIVRDGQIVTLDTEEAIETGDLLPLEALQLRSGDMIVVDRRSTITFASVLAAINVILATVLIVDRILE